MIDLNIILNVIIGVFIYNISMYTLRVFVETTGKEKRRRRRSRNKHKPIGLDWEVEVKNTGDSVTSCKPDDDINNKSEYHDRVSERLMDEIKRNEQEKERYVELRNAGYSTVDYDIKNAQQQQNDQP